MRPHRDGTANPSAKHRRHCVDVQVVTDRTGDILVDLTRPLGRAHELTATRTNKIIPRATATPATR